MRYLSLAMEYSDGLIVVADDINSIYLDSSISAVGIALDKFIKNGNDINSNPLSEEDISSLEKCEKCNAMSWKNENGCGSCIDCGHSKCN